MKIAILSDIHGNIYAFREVIKSMKQQNIDVVFLLGDQLGYYYDVLEVFSEIKKWDHHIIAGNHERIFSKYLNSDLSFREKIVKKYGNCFSYYQKYLPASLIEEIKKLPDKKDVKIDGHNFLLCHGSPLEEDQYVYPDSEKHVLEQLSFSGHDYVFMGHTHYPMIYNIKETMLINVGSVGQARNVGGIANWGIFNTSNNVYTPQATPYNIDLLKTFLVKNEEKEYLHKVLKRNNSTL
ncbi:MAG: metallophosphoesterase family protein [Flavobacteriaceae bacterium]